MFTIRRSMKFGPMPKSSSSYVQRLTRALVPSASSMTAVAVAAPVPPTTTKATTCKKIRIARTAAELSDDYVVAFLDILDLYSSSLSA